MQRAVNQGHSLEEILEATQNKPVSFFNEKNKFQHQDMGDFLIDQYHICKINGTLHIYDNGVYRADTEFILGKMIELCKPISDRQRKEVLRYLEAAPNVPAAEVSPPELIPFKSRIYDIVNDCFLEYSPEYVFLNRFPYDYNPEAADEPLILQTVQDIADGNEEIIKLLFEAIGNCFCALNAFRGAIVLYGPHGFNGKSTLLNLIAQLVGRDNASFLSLQDLAERFRLIGIYGKAVNIGDDIGDSYLEHSEMFKKIVTGETVVGEAKGKQPVFFKPYCKLMFAMNELPPVKDKSRAFFSRLLLIPLNHDFSGDGDVSLKDRKWTEAEMECILKYAIEGLKRLRQQGRFTQPAVVRLLMARYKIENDPIAMFLEDRTAAIEDKPVSEVYADYKYWCDIGGYKPVTINKFSRDIHRLTGVETKAKRESGSTKKFFVIP